MYTITNFVAIRAVSCALFAKLLKRQHQQGKHAVLQSKEKKDEGVQENGIQIVM